MDTVAGDAVFRCVGVSVELGLMPCVDWIEAVSDRLAGNGSVRSMIVAAWAATGLCCFYYLFLVTNGDFNLFAREPLGAIFDHMAWNLLHWRFTIDPEVVGREAFLWHGGIYSYFGILPAVLRLPLVVLYGPDPPSLSRLSCWAGLIIIATAATSILLNAWRQLPPMPNRDSSLAVVLAATLLTGPLLSMTFTAWVYNEPIVWGTALAMLFLRLVLLQTTGATPSGGVRWLWMGALAGLAFLVRPIPGLAMSVALALAVLLISAVPPTIQLPGGRAARLLGMVRAATWAGIGFLPLFGFALLVNWERWGDPLIFAPTAANIQVMADPRRLRIATERGLFELDRLPLGIGYYVFGLSGDGWMASLTARVSDGLGWPRSAFIATSTTQIVMGLIGCVGLARHRMPEFLRGGSGLCLVAMPVIMAGMVLTLMFMNYRYRLEFLPLFVVCCLGGMAGLACLGRIWARRTTLALAMLVIGNITISHLDLLQAKVASFAQTEAARERIIRNTWPVSGLFVSKPVER